MVQQVRDKIFEFKFTRNVQKIPQRVDDVNRSVQQFADNIFAVIEAKKQDIIHEVENQGKQSFQQLGIQRNAIEQQAQKFETWITKSETLLQGSTSPEIAQIRH